MTTQTRTLSKEMGVNDWIEYENTRHGFQARPDNPLATYTEFPETFRPGAPSYRLPLFEISETACLIFRSTHPDPSLEEHYFPKGKVQFPVHPVNRDNESIPHIEEITSHPLQEIAVRPTSSTRTVFIEDETLAPHCLKPHTDLRITRWRRHMESRKIAHAIAVTKIFENCRVFKEYLKVGFFPESLGAVFGVSGAQKDWGFILREMQSQPHLEHSYKMIPLNALYTPSTKDRAADPLLVEMIVKSTKSPKDFLIEEIIQPLITGWIKIYLETGVLLEPHGQNVIVEIDEKSGEIIRFSHRDFDCEINKDVLVENGYPLTHLNTRDLFTIEGDNWAPQGSHLSIIFDNSMQVALEKLADIGAKYFALSEESIREECRAFLDREFSSFLSVHFSRNGKAYNFKKTQTGVSIVEKKHPPRWRSQQARDKATIIA
ncbi:MAG: hypothetical protein GWP15_04200 [Nitrospirae bacterium]|nr:hypothetical protein [Nitrospirota bacterium]